MSTEEPPLSRAERRRLTEQRILDCARQSFGELGYDRATIRVIARAAKVDPALVMQYFGNKENLFRQVVRLDAAGPAPESADPLIAQLMAGLGVKLAGMPAPSLAMLRSMLTHPDMAAEMRETFDRQIKQVSAVVEGEDAELRAALLIMANLGVVVGKHLLELGPLRDTRPERIIELLDPCFRALVDPAP
ncbi:TetR/AcrR family transcriptional regulator [Streptomyces canus]|uniref:TetR/AcrR family transcriptional regulator n=1 Tax=Streptomyces canus TaxID=58343 RepID=UPI00278A9890|nr:TetR/AcrR family transcriptional regulator [Streptomyces canus]MDQ1072392.1 AcrR family transcriptional regulator [Streptomyces canus]